MLPVSPDVAADFDQVASALAALPASRALTRAERWLLDQMDRRGARALDVGCGDGRLTAHVAETIASVRGIDLSPRMVALATARWARPGRLEFAVDDLEHFRSPHGGFDVVVSVNTVHHGPLAPMVRCLAALVAPGGQLLIQDLVARDGWRDGPRNALAWLARWPAVHGGSRAQAALRAAYARHGAGERYCTADEARSAYRVLLPGARFKHHLAWRYSVVWRRPAP